MRWITFSLSFDAFLDHFYIIKHNYEFKHLLKSSQLKFSRKKDIHVVLKEDNEAQKRYEALFGKNNVKIFQDGIKGYLEDLGMSYSNRPEKPGYYQNNSLITS